MLSPKLDQIVGLSLICACVLSLASAACCSPHAERTMLNGNVWSPLPGDLTEIDAGCWDASTLTMIDVPKMRASDSVGVFWDMMKRLRASPGLQHQELFMRLAQAFWERYVDCVLSRAHGLGRRSASLVKALRQSSLQGSAFL